MSRCNQGVPSSSKFFLRDTNSCTNSLGMLVVPPARGSCLRTTCISAVASTAIDGTDALSAAATGDADLLRECLHADQSLIAATDANGATPMHCAAFTGHLECALVMLACCESENLRAVDAYGFRPIDWAVLNGQASVARLLCAADFDHASVAAGDEMLLTPLQMAAASGDVDVVDALVDGGVLEVESPVAITPLQLACTLGHDECAQALRAAQAGQPPPPPLPPSPPPSAAPIRRITAAELAADRSVWDEALRSSVPLLIDGLADEWAGTVGNWGFDELRRRWGDQPVQVAYSPDVEYQRIEQTGEGGPFCLREPPTSWTPSPILRCSNIPSKPEFIQRRHLSSL